MAPQQECLIVSAHFVQDLLCIISCKTMRLIWICIEIHTYREIIHVNPSIQDYFCSCQVVLSHHSCKTNNMNHFILDQFCEQSNTRPSANKPVFFCIFVALCLRISERLSAETFSTVNADQLRAIYTCCV